MRIRHLKKVKIFSFVLSWLSTHCYSDLSWSEHFLCLMWFQSINLLPCARSMDNNRDSMECFIHTSDKFFHYMYLFCCLDSTQDGSGGALDDATDQEAIYVQIKKFQVCIILFQCFFVCDMGESNICQYFVFPVHHFCPVFWICIFHQCLPSFQWLMVKYYRLCQNTCKQPYCVIQLDEG